ncbi:MAG: sulfite exporter TauE/SafE family protein [Burkholderiales bacterium]|nr:sulfite exporter TauE/SafE family protein [Burkholderiales bacterium]
MTIPFDLSTFVIAAAAVAAAYVIFGISAFGAALFTVPLLSFFYPLDFVLPMVVLLDLAAALALGRRFSREADKSELKWLAPFSIAGAILGVTLLVTLPRSATLIALGVFLLAYGAYSLHEGVPTRRVSRGWAPVAGFAGGTMGTLFGAGAPPYAIYLSRRLQDKGRLRATLSNIVLLSVTIRALVFTFSGLMLADRLIAFVMLVPFAFAGLWLGNRIHGRISHAALLRFVAVLLVLMGLSLLGRAVF